jgi:CDP-diglyceride synthetase
MEEAVEKIAIISFLLIGLSHIFQPKVWVQFFTEIREKREAGAFINAFIHFPLGVIIVAFHNVWQGIPVILTLMGYGLVLKGFVYFVFPKIGLMGMSRVSPEKSWEFVIPGIALVGIACLLLYSLLSR